MNKNKKLKTMSDTQGSIRTVKYFLTDKDDNYKRKAFPFLSILIWSIYSSDKKYHLSVPQN